MSEQILILKGIDLPEASEGPKSKYPFDTMEIGETFFLAGKKASKFSPYAGKFGRKATPVRKFQVRDVAMIPTKDSDGNVVGWKIGKATEPGAVVGCACKRLADETPAEAAAAAKKAAGETKDAAGDKKPDATKAPATAKK